MATLFEQWQELIENQTQETFQEFWEEYSGAETKIYSDILDHPAEKMTGKLGELAEKYEVRPVIFMGFLDGINESIIKQASKDNINTIITCDNGIAAITQVELAKSLGIKVIITDHHDIPFIEDENGEREFVIPPADVVINPKQIDCKYPFKSLCGAAVA
ncbi:MAG: hypothetical protein HUJ79_02280, partial [Firmicutes bacterium]|nr:hypothetical protein [Bacillota bacterium]